MRRPNEQELIARFFRPLATAPGAAMLSDDAATIPPADAPTWVALVAADLSLPPGSVGYVLDPRGAAGVEVLAAADLVADLANFAEVRSR